MNARNVVRTFLAAAFSLSLAFTGVSEAAAQGITTSAVSGVVRDGGGQPLRGAQIVVRNTATGAQTGGLSNNAGRYFIQHLQPGGPYTLTVELTEAGGGLTDTATVTVNVTDVNEGPTANAATFAVAENAANATTLGSVTGSDPESDALTYAITAGNTGGLFAVDAATGALTVADNSGLDHQPTCFCVASGTAQLLHNYLITLTHVAVHRLQRHIVVRHRRAEAQVFARPCCW